MKTETIIIKLEKELKDKFLEKCWENRTNRSDVIRKFIKYYNGHKPK